MDKLIKTGCLGAFCLLLAACGSPQQTLYYWGNNNADVYERLKSDGKPLGEQIDAMEKYFQKTRSENKKEAPGTHAHLGMLLSEAGQISRQRNTSKPKNACSPNLPPSWTSC